MTSPFPLPESGMVSLISVKNLPVDVELFAEWFKDPLKGCGQEVTGTLRGEVTAFHYDHSRRSWVYTIAITSVELAVRGTSPDKWNGDGPPGCGPTSSTT